MTAVREIMNTSTAGVKTDETSAEAARRMGELGVGALPICGPNDKIKGMVIGRDVGRNAHVG